jgi:hypothetical protein
MLQHPLAVAWSKGGLYVADSYNGKVKRFDPGFTSLSTVLADAEGLPLAGPAGLAVEADGDLLVADTDRSRLLRLPAAGGAARAVAVHDAGETPVVAAAGATSIAPHFAVHVLPSRSLAAGSSVANLALVSPDGFAFSEGSPWQMDLAAQGGLQLGKTSLQGEAAAGGRVETAVPLSLETPGRLLVRVHASICDAVHHAACYPVRETFAVALSSGGSDDRVDLPLSVPAGAPRSAAP